MTAKIFRSGRSGVVGLAVPELGQPYFGELADEILAAARRHGLQVLIEPTGFTREGELAALRVPRRGLVDGLIFSPAALVQADAHLLDALGYPLVLLGEQMFSPSVDHVTMRNIDGARAATDLLLDAGRRHIAVIGMLHAETAGSAWLRYTGYQQALEARGIEVDTRLLGWADVGWHRANGARAMADVLDTGVPVDGVVAFNDALAIGAMYELQSRGLAIPQDVGVVGFDDIEDSRYSVPTLTTVDPGRREIANVAVDILRRRMREGPGPSAGTALLCSTSPACGSSSGRARRDATADPTAGCRRGTSSTPIDTSHAPCQGDGSRRPYTGVDLAPSSATRQPQPTTRGGGRAAGRAARHRGRHRHVPVGRTGACPPAAARAAPPAARHLRTGAPAGDAPLAELMVYRPAGGPDVPGVFVNLHGGGFVLGDWQDDDPYCRYLADAAGCVVVNVDYLLAPEHKFPAAVHQTAALLAWLTADASTIGADGSRIAVGGHSAGGNLSAAACLVAARHGDPQVRGLIVDYAPLDLATPPSAKLADAGSPRRFRARERGRSLQRLVPADAGGRLGRARLTGPGGGPLPPAADPRDHGRARSPARRG